MQLIAILVFALPALVFLLLVILLIFGLVLFRTDCILDLSPVYDPNPMGQGWSEVVRLVNPQFAPQWTLDGGHILMSFDASIYVVRSDGSNLQRFSKAYGQYDFDYSPDISPDGSRIVYTTMRHKSEEPYVSRNFELETSALDGSHSLRLTENRLIDTSPAWSPDGTRIAFVRDGDPGADLDQGIYTMASDGSDVIAVMDFRRGGVSLEDPLVYQEIYAGPVWSPDGKKLAFVLIETESLRGGRRNRQVLYTINADGSGLTRMFAGMNRQTDEIMGSPAWSPDGKSLAFAHSSLDDGTKLYTIDPDGSGLRTMTDEAGSSPTSDANLSWSPDGSSLLFPTGTKAVYVIKADGSDIRTIKAPGSAIRRFGGRFGASWSPDGSRIAMAHVDSNATDILSTVAPDGSDLRVLVKSDEDGNLVAVNDGTTVQMAR